MHSKLRNSLIGLLTVVAFVSGSALFGAPVVSDGQRAPTHSVTSPEMQLMITLLTAGMQTAQASEQADEAATQDPAVDTTATSQTGRAARHSRQSLGMPYFSFASVLPRAPQES